MALRCGALSEVVEVDENDIIWELPPKKSVVRWPNSSSIATPIVSKEDRHRKPKPRGILKSSMQIRTQDCNHDDDHEDRNDGACASTPGTTQLSPRRGSCDDDGEYPLARLEYAGHTPRGNRSTLSSSSYPHRRGRIQSDSTNSDIQSTQRRRRRNNNNLHRLPTKCPICFGKLSYFHISANTQQVCKDIDGIHSSSEASTTVAAILPAQITSATLNEITMHSDQNEEETEECQKILQSMCKSQSLLPPHCKSCQTYLFFDDIDCKHEMIKNFERWYDLDNNDVVVDDDRDESDDGRTNGGTNNRGMKICHRFEESTFVKEKEVDVDLIPKRRRRSVVELHRHRSHAKIVVVNCDSPSMHPPPPDDDDDRDVGDAALPTKSASTDASCAATTTTTAALPTSNTTIPFSEREQCDDIITPRLSIRVAHKTIQLDKIDCNMEIEQSTSPTPEESLLASSSTSESINLINTESEERKILEDYSMKKEIASAQLVQELMKGYNKLDRSVCVRCKMPMMKRNSHGDTRLICATCPSVHQRAQRIAQQKRTTMKVEKHRREGKHNSRDIALVPGKRVGSDDVCDVISDSSTNPTNNLNALEEGRMGPNSSSFASMDHAGMNERCCYYNTNNAGLNSSSNVELNSQISTNNSNQPIDYWVRHSSSSQLNDHYQQPIMQTPSDSKPPSFPSRHTISNSNSDLQHGSMNEPIERGASNPLVAESSSEESSTRCPRFSNSYEMIYRLEDESSMTASTEQRHNYLKTMEHNSRINYRMGSDARDIQSINTDGIHVRSISAIATTDTVTYTDQIDHNEGCGTSSDESSTRCPGNFPPSEMIWQYEHRINATELDPMDSKYVTAYVGDVTNSSTVMRHIDAYCGNECNGLRFDRKYHRSSNGEASSEPSVINRHRHSHVEAPFSGASMSTIGRNASFNYYHQIKDDSEESSEVSQIYQCDLKQLKQAAQTNPANPAGLHDGRGPESQDHSAHDSRDMSNKYRENKHFMLNRRTVGWHADVVQAQYCHELRCNSNHQSSEISETSSEVSNIQHQVSLNHSVEHHRPNDICMRIARLATSLRTFEHETTRVRDKIDDQMKPIHTFPTQPMSDETNCIELGNGRSQINHTSSLDKQIRESEERDDACSSRFRRSPDCFWPITDTIGCSARIPISPIAVGGRDKQTSGVSATNRFFTTNSRFQYSLGVRSDCASMNEHRADPPGFRIENMNYEPRDSSVARRRPVIVSRKVNYGLNDTAKSNGGMVSLPEALTMRKKHHISSGADRYGRDCDTPKLTGRKSTSVIPTVEVGEYDMPLTRVQSSGESSVDKLMKQIDEIEDDFASVVASLPGSKDVTSVSLMSSNNSLKSSNAHSLIEITVHNAQSFESNSSAVSLVTDAVHRMRRMKDCIYQNDSTDEGGASDECSYNSRGRMSELIQNLNNAAESLRTLNEWDE